MSAPPKSTPTAFEFTKRKRWADLLIHELSEAIILVLSPDAKVWFCGRAVADFLGWFDAELIDRPLTDLINSEDQRAFLIAFDESLRTRTEMNSYVRLKTRSAQSEVLFEIKGYPYYIEDEMVARCFFAVAMPYPSRNAAMLNTFLELKIENERLQKRLAELRVCAPSPSPLVSGPSTSPVYSLSSSSMSRPPAPSTSLCPPDVSSALGSQHMTRITYDSFASSVAQVQGTAYESLGGLHAYSGHYMSSTGAQPTDDDFGDDSSRRKKIRKSHNAEQYVCVTCGRTDSPEWRKGPQGPKTLCNACGLRWAKEIRSKVDDHATVGASGPANNA